MTDILVITPLCNPGKGWEGVVEPPTMGSPQHRVYSPRQQNPFGHPRTLGLRVRKGENMSFDLYPTDGRPLSAGVLRLSTASMILPIIGERGCWRGGLCIHDSNGRYVATFAPAHCGDRGADWPDWRAPLEARGLALLGPVDIRGCDLA